MYDPHLDIFLQVAELGSFSRAAEALYISAPAVIKQIGLLEDRIGVKLFLRTHQGASLTEAGKSLYGDAKRIIQDSNEAVIRARNAMQSGDNVVRIGTSPMTPGQYILKLWPTVQELCPGVKFQLIPFENTPQNARDILRNLGRDIDIVAGAFDQNFLETRQCAGLELLQALMPTAAPPIWLPLRTCLILPRGRLSTCPAPMVLPISMPLLPPHHPPCPRRTRLCL